MDKDLETAISRVAEFFKNDEAKTLLWFKTKNPQLADFTPIEMIQSGRAKRLIDFINFCLD